MTAASEGGLVYDDPFMPASRRFPRDVWPPIGSIEQASPLRPFVLRGTVPGGVPSAKHRTPKTREPHTDPTTNDGTTVPDTWYSPDD